MSIDELVLGTDETIHENFAALCRDAFGSGSGAKILAMLTNGVPPMSPSVSTEGTNDPMTVGLREGRRETVAFLFRYAGTTFVNRVNTNKA